MLHEIHPRFCSSESLACISLVCSSRGVAGPAGPRLRVLSAWAPVAAAAPGRGGSAGPAVQGEPSPARDRAVLPARRWPRRPAATGDRDGCVPPPRLGQAGAAHSMDTSSCSEPPRCKCSGAGDRQRQHSAAAAGGTAVVALAPRRPRLPGSAVVEPCRCSEGRAPAAGALGTGTAAGGTPTVTPRPAPPVRAAPGAAGAAGTAAPPPAPAAALPVTREGPKPHGQKHVWGWRREAGGESSRKRFANVFGGGGRREMFYFLLV